jgi:hypothetical protein
MLYVQAHSLLNSNGDDQRQMVYTDDRLLPVPVRPDGLDREIEGERVRLRPAASVKFAADYAPAAWRTSLEHASRCARSARLVLA